MSSPALSSGSQLSASSSFQELSTVESALQDEALGERQEEGEEDGVAVARPPRSAAASAEVVLSGQAALDALDQVLGTRGTGRQRHRCTVYTHVASLTLFALFAAAG